VITQYEERAALADEALHGADLLGVEGPRAVDQDQHTSSTDIDRRQRAPVDEP
jgi:hypothetical protein